MNKKNSCNTGISLWEEIFKNYIPMFRWDNYKHMRYWYNEETDSLDCECGLSMDIDIPTDKLSKATVRNLIIDFEDKIFDYYLDRYNIRLNIYD